MYNVICKIKVSFSLQIYFSDKIFPFLPFLDIHCILLLEKTHIILLIIKATLNSNRSNTDLKWLLLESTTPEIVAFRSCTWEAHTKKVPGAAGLMVPPLTITLLLSLKSSPW